MAGKAMPRALRWAAVAGALLSAVLAAGCGAVGGGGVSGMYGPVFSPDQASQFPYTQIEFRSGGKAQVSRGEGAVVEVAYATEGKQVKITDDGKTAVYEVDGSGCVKSGKDVVYCKAPTKIDGLTYQGADGDASIEFKGGGKARADEFFDATYTVTGDQVVIVIDDRGKSMVEMVLSKGGCLDMKGREGSLNFCPLYPQPK